jgi:5-formyltetrahydrofolate cyclo-ligase
MNTKAEARRFLREQTASLSAEAKTAASQQLCGRLLHTPELTEGAAVGIYLSLPDEPDLRPAITCLLERNCRVALPFLVDRDTWGFREIRSVTPETSGPWDLGFPPEGPRISPSDLELILVPGRGFTRKGHRIGRGKGIYDRLLSDTRAKKIGVCFSCQIVKELPVDEHDIRMDDVWDA